MKALTYTLTLMGAVALAGFAAPARAEVIGADDFSESDGTGINGKAPDVGGGNWSGPGGQTIVGGILDTKQVGQHQGSFLDLARALGAGEVLTLRFTSAESAGLMFDINGYAGMSFYIGGDEKLFIGDPGGGQPVNGWSLDGFAGGSGLAQSGLGAEAVNGVFTYSYDTGAASLTVTDGANSATATRTYDPGLGLNRLRIQSGSSDGTGLAIDSFTVTAGVVPEPASLGLIALGTVALMLRARRS